MPLALRAGRARFGTPRQDAPPHQAPASPVGRGRSEPTGREARIFVARSDSPCMAGPGSVTPPWISEGMLREPRSIEFWGNSRVALNRAAYEVAHRINPRYVWLEIGSPEDEVDPDDPAHTGVIPDDMLYRTVRPAEFKPDNATANLAMWSVVRQDEPDEVLHPLMDFLRLPERVQEVIGNAPREDRPAVYVAANADRVLQFYPDDPSSTAPILAVFVRERMSLIVTILNRTRSDRFLHDYVFEIRSAAGAKWQDALLVCERAPPGQGYEIGAAVRAFPGA